MHNTITKQLKKFITKGWFFKSAFNLKIKGKIISYRYLMGGFISIPYYAKLLLTCYQMLGNVANDDPNFK